MVLPLSVANDQPFEDRVRQPVKLCGAALFCVPTGAIAPVVPPPGAVCIPASGLEGVPVPPCMGWGVWAWAMPMPSAITDAIRNSFLICFTLLESAARSKSNADANVVENGAFEGLEVT
jgi:hypothetical protein